MTTHGIPGRSARLAIWGGIAVILLVSLVAMRFTDEVRWTAFDFAVAALLLGGGALAYEIATRLTRSARGRLLAGAAVLAIVLFVWAHGAVGIF